MKISEIVLSGQVPNSLSLLCLSKVDVSKGFNHYEREPDWQFSSSIGRLNIMNGMLTASKGSTDADHRKKMIRGSLILAINDEAGAGPQIASVIVNGEHANDIGLNDKELDELRALIAQYTARTNAAFFEELMILAADFDNMIAQDAAAVSLETYLQWLRRYEALYARAPDDVGIVQNYTRLLWRFCCLARSRQQAEVMQEAERTATRLAETVASDHVKRWLADSATIAGPIPKHSGYRQFPVGVHADGVHKPPR